MSEFTSASNNDVPASSAMKIPQQDDSDSSEDREVPEHVRQVHARLERCLRHLGLTPFSTKFIVQHVSVCMSFVFFFKFIFIAFLIIIITNLIL